MTKHPWQVELGYGYYWLDSEPYLTHTSLKFKKTWKQKFNHSLSVQIASYDSPTETYQYYQGSGKKVAYQLASKGRQAWRWKFDFSYKDDDRDGNHYLAQNDNGETFNAETHYGKNSWQAKASIGWHKSAKWTPALSLFYRQSIYDAPDLYLAYSDDTELTQLEKEAQRIGISGNLSYQINKNWEMNGKYQWVKEDASVDRYSFENNTMSIGVEYSFD